MIAKSSWLQTILGILFSNLSIKICLMYHAVLQKNICFTPESSLFDYGSKHRYHHYVHEHWFSLESAGCLWPELDSLAWLLWFKNLYSLSYLSSFFPGCCYLLIKSNSFVSCSYPTMTWQLEAIQSAEECHAIYTYHTIAWQVFLHNYATHLPDLERSSSQNLSWVTA